MNFLPPSENIQNLPSSNCGKICVTVGLHFVKIKNQDAAANLKIASFRFFLDDFSHLSIQCALCIRVEKDVDVVSCVSDSHGQQSVRGAMFGQCDSFAHLRFSFLQCVFSYILLGL